MVLFGVPPQERAKETGAPEQTLYHHVQRFAQHAIARRDLLRQILVPALAIANDETYSYDPNSGYTKLPTVNCWRSAVEQRKPVDNFTAIDSEGVVYAR